MGTDTFTTLPINLSFDSSTLTLAQLEAGILQIASSFDGETATGTTLVAYDDSIPQITEGDQYLSVSITPLSATNTLEIDAVVYATASAARTITASLYQDSTANALKSGAVFVPSTQVFAPIILRHSMLAGTTSSTTFKVRAGVNSAGTLYFNGDSGGRKYGGVLSSYITIKEIKT